MIDVVKNLKYAWEAGRLVDKSSDQKSAPGFNLWVSAREFF